MDVRRAAITALISAASLAAPTVALAHEQGAGEGVGAYLHKVLGPDVTRLANGDLKVDPAVGPPLVTHGPDGRSEMLDETQLGVNDVFLPGAAERDPVCSTDFGQQFLYAYPATGTNRLASVADDLRSQVRRDDNVLNTSSLLSGGGTADYKIRCDGSGEIALAAVPVTGTSFSAVVSSVKAAGYRDGNTDYTVFLDASSSSACGVGSFSSDESLSAGNANNTGLDYGVVYSGCWHTRTAMHENGHNMGAVQAGAPHSTGDGAHCNQDYDVMCYSPDGGDKNQGGDVLTCSDAIYFDCGFDDYFDSAPATGQYLASHWNLGSPLNRFVAFGPVPPGGGSSTPPSGGGTTSGGSGSGGSGGSGGSSSGSGSTTVPTSGSTPTSHPDAVQRLHLGRPLHSQAAAQGEVANFKLWLPPGLRHIRLHGTAGTDLDLAVRRGYPPSSTHYSCAAGGPGAIERCTVHVHTAAPYFVGVLTNSGAGSGFTIAAH